TAAAAAGVDATRGARRVRFAAMTTAPCETHLDILPEWTDQNGHMNVAYYVLAFDRATDSLYNDLGIGWSYFHRTRGSTFSLAMNIDYVRELFAGDGVRIVSRLI